MDSPVVYLIRECGICNYVNPQWQSINYPAVSGFTGDCFYIVSRSFLLPFCSRSWLFHIYTTTLVHFLPSLPACSAVCVIFTLHTFACWDGNQRHGTVTHLEGVTRVCRISCCLRGTCCERVLFTRVEQANRV